MPADGETPVFAQLYVYDAELENTQRFNNMILPASVTKSQKIKLKEILDEVQSEIHRVNPFVSDFKQILEIEDEELVGGKLILSARAPRTEHSRRYNLQANLKEVSVLTTEERHDLVIRKRGGGLQYISDLNPKGRDVAHTVMIAKYYNPQIFILMHEACHFTFIYLNICGCVCPSVCNIMLL